MFAAHMLGMMPCLIVIILLHQSARPTHEGRAPLGGFPPLWEIPWSTGLLLLLAVGLLCGVGFSMWFTRFLPNMLLGIVNALTLAGPVFVTARVSTGHLHRRSGAE